MKHAAQIKTAIGRALKQKSWQKAPYAPLLVLCLAVAYLVVQFGEYRAAIPPVPDSVITCNTPYIIDGDTFDCGGRRIRLTSIDAPEMPGSCRPGRRCTPGDPHAARDMLEDLTNGDVSCRVIEIDHYDRVIGQCTGPEGDLSCAMVETGHAVQRYRPLYCP